MTRTSDGFLEALGDEAREQLKSLSEARTYRGENPEYRQRAKLALGVIGSYVRLRATLANERTNELVERRMLADGTFHSVRVPPAIGDGGGE